LTLSDGMLKCFPNWYYLGKSNDTIFYESPSYPKEVDLLRVSRGRRTECGGPRSAFYHGFGGSGTVITIGVFLGTNSLPILGVGFLTSQKGHAVVTGGGSGIGRAIARTLAGEGWSVSVLDLSEERAQAVADEITRDGGTARGVACDLSTRDGAQGGVLKARSALGPVKALVNNVGIYPSGPFVEIKDQDWDLVMNVCLKSFLWCSQESLVDMMAQRSGKIVNMASIDGKTPGPGNAAYSAAKAGVISLTRSLAAEMAEFNINVNAVAPGWVETPNILKSDRWKEAIKRIPIGRLAKPEEIADAVSFLLSEKAVYITGEVLNINGGMLMD